MSIPEQSGDSFDFCVLFRVYFTGKGAGYDCTILKHIFQIDQTAIVHRLCNIVEIVYMDDAVIVGGDHICREQEATADVLADFACHIVPLHTVDSRIFVGIFLHHFFIVTLNER